MGEDDVFNDDFFDYEIPDDLKIEDEETDDREIDDEKIYDLLLVRSIQIYEFPYLDKPALLAKQNINSQLKFNLESAGLYCYKPNQRINGKKHLNLVTNCLIFKTNNQSEEQINIEFSNNNYKNLVEFNIIEEIHPSNYISPYLRGDDIDPCFLVQKNQFVSNY